MSSDGGRSSCRLRCSKTMKDLVLRRFGQASNLLTCRRFQHSQPFFEGEQIKMIKCRESGCADHSFSNPGRTRLFASSPPYLVMSKETMLSSSTSRVWTDPLPLAPCFLTATRQRDFVALSQSERPWWGVAIRNAFPFAAFIWHVAQCPPRHATPN